MCTLEQVAYTQKGVFTLNINSVRPALNTSRVRLTSSLSQASQPSEELPDPCGGREIPHSRPSALDTDADGHLAADDNGQQTTRNNPEERRHVGGQTPNPDTHTKKERKE